MVYYGISIRLRMFDLVRAVCCVCAVCVCVCDVLDRSLTHMYSVIKDVY